MNAMPSPNSKKKHEINDALLNTTRKKIDSVDKKILLLLKERAELAVEAKQLKKGKDIYKPGREAEIMNRLRKLNDGRLSNDAIINIFREIVGSCRNLESPLRVAYLGPKGTYSHEAAVKMFGSTSAFMPKASLREAARAVEVGTSDVALLPLENSSEGSVAETHKILLNTQLKISSALTMPIRHKLISRAPELSAIQSVHAHPQALGQCREWLQHHIPNALLITETSNSQAVAFAANRPDAAAIASSQAADIYNVPILVSGINDTPDNTTRFIALSRHVSEPTGNDKTSLICTVRDKPGALHELLGIFYSKKINLTRLVSQPHPDDLYVFYIDFEGHKDKKTVAAALIELIGAAKSCKVLGSYPESVYGY